MPLPPEHLLDELATAYIQAIAAAAGSIVAVSRRDYGVDGTLKQIIKDGGRFVETGFPVDFQLKGTSIVDKSGSHLKYDLNARNYDLIVSRPLAATPYYLFLVCFGPEADQRLVEEDDRLVLAASAYWWTQSGTPIENARSVRIEVPKVNRLNAIAIERMLIESRKRFSDD